MRFGGWIGAMTGLSCLSTNGGLAYMDRWPPLTLPIEPYEHQKRMTISVKMNRQSDRIC